MSTFSTVIRPGILFIEGEFKGKFPFSNSLLIKGKKRTALIDAGTGIRVIQHYKDKIDVVVLTHLHPDHFSLSYLFEGKRVYIPAVESRYRRLEDLALRYVGEKLAPIWLRYVKETMMARDPYFTDTYEEGDVIDLGNVELQPIYTPGHSLGHHVILIGDKILHGADIDLTSFGPWYGHVESNIDKFLDSIKRVMQLDVEIYVSGHKRPVTGREEILSELERFAGKFKETEERILEALREPKSVEELVHMGIIYQKKPYARELLEYWEANMIMKHLDRLVKRGLVRTTTNGKYIAIKDL